MNRVISYEITEDANGQTIGNFLKNKGYSRPIMVHLKKTRNSILKNGIWSYVRTVLNTGDRLEIHFVETGDSENIVPSYISLDDFWAMTVYEDEDILVINKPAGLPVHPSMGHYENTLANYCTYYYKTLNPSEGGFVFRCVNRLDRDTSGLVLIAKNMLSSACLSLRQQNRSIHRTYLAIASGITPQTGTINLPVARKEKSVIERCVDMEHGESAITHYERLEYIDTPSVACSLVKLWLETGRTHQIRVHMKAIGYPLLGDFLYNPDFTHIKRQALHSYMLEFTHPITSETLCFRQNPPEDFFFTDWETFSCNK